MRRFFIILLLVLCLPVFLPAQQADWYVGKTIEEIRFEGLISVAETELSGLIRPHIGSPYDDALSWDIQGKLYALDYFDIIIPEILPSDSGGIILVFQVQEKPQVNTVTFIGNSKIRRGELQDTVLVKAGDLLNPGALRIDEQAISALYLEKGFIDAVVSSGFTVDDATNGAEVVFTIQEGGQTKISEIRFIGNDKHVADSTLQRQMETKAQSLFNKRLFVETKLQEDLKAIEHYYRDQGFIDMRIVDVNREIIFDTEENVNKMIVSIVIEEGEAWYFGGVTFRGNEVYSSQELEALLSQQPGDIYSDTKFQIDFQRIQDLYYENGYIFNQFSAPEVRDEAKRIISYEITVQEFDRAHVENIIIRGNTKTKAYVILREFPLEEGEVFSKTKILEGLMNLYNLQYFDTVEPTPYPGSQDGLMDIVIDVAEGKTSDIGFGLSFSGGADFPISGQISWNDRNFLGRGQNVGVELTVSPDGVRSFIRFTEPKLFGVRWAGGFDVSYSWSKTRYIRQDRDLNGIPDPYATWEEYDEESSVPEDSQMEYRSHYLSTGYSTGYTWVTRAGRFGISGNISLIWQYVIYDDRIYTPYNNLIRENLNTWKYNDSLTVKGTWDTRDLQFNPTKGFLLSEAVTFAGVFGLGNRHYIKSVSRFNWNQQLFNVPVGKKEGTFQSIFETNSAFSALMDKPFREPDCDIVDTNGFSVDGMFVARGWPTSTDRYKFLWDNTVQLKFPIVRNILAFDLFLDAVGAWQTDDLLEDDFFTGEQWRFSLGGGFRFDNPQFPIGIYLVKRFQWQEGSLSWYPDSDSSGGISYDNYEFSRWGLDLVIASNMDIY